MRTRPFGETGIELSIIGFGGIVVMGAEPDTARKRVASAIDRGVNYFDVAPTYGDAEERLGPALDGYRDAIFLAGKTEQRQRQPALEALHTTLRRLRTDHLDLYQLHGVASRAEAEACLAPGGALEALVAARDAGLTRFLGFSAHSVEAALLLMEQFAFDSLLFPFNYTAYLQGGFGPQVMDAAMRRGVARLALKAMARRPWPADAARLFPNCWYEPHADPAEAELALRWTLSLPVTAAIPPGDPGLFELALDIAERFTPLRPDEERLVEERAMRDTPLFAMLAAG